MLLALLVPLSLEAADRTVCASGCDHSSLQDAINAAARGDNIILTAGETFTGNFTFPNKGAGTTPIVITSNAAAGNLPGTGVRTGPQYAAFLPKIQASAGGLPALQVQSGANYLTIRHVEFKPNPLGFGDIIALGFATSAQDLASEEPHDIILDRVYIHGDPIYGQKRGVSVNARDVTISNSYFDDFLGVGQDANSIAGANSTGDWTITNNYIGGGAEPFIVGGQTVHLRTYFTVASSPTTTGANVAIVEAGHNCNEVIDNQHVAIETSAGVLFSQLSATPASGTTCALAWDAIATAPSVGHRIRMGKNPTNITFTNNHIKRNPIWVRGPLAQPTGLTATPSTASGSLAAGTYYYRTQAWNVGGGYQGQTIRSDVSAQVSGTLTATGEIDLAWTDSTGETIWRVWRFATSGATTGEYTTTGSTSFTDDGTATWTGAAYQGGTRWVLKNMLELKTGVNVTVSGNIFENGWHGTDIGYTGAWIKNVDSDGGNWFVQTRDVVVEHNIWRTMCGWLLFEGRKSTATNPLPNPLHGVTIRNNLVYDSNSAACQGGLPYAMISTGPIENLTIDHNTVIHVTPNTSGLWTTGSAGQTVLTGFVMRSNMLIKGLFGVHNSGGFNKAALDISAPSGYTFTNNAIGYNDGTAAGTWPANNSLTTMTSWEQNFVSYSATASGGNFRLKSSSPYVNAGHDSTDIGADIDAIEAATAGVDTGMPESDPPVITTTVLPESLEDVSYGTQTVQRTGGTAPFTFSISAGTLPTGLTIDSGTGAITGTPTTPGVYPFTVQVVDNVAESDTQVFTVTIYAVVAVTTTTLPGGNISTAYSTTLEATGDQTPYTWAVTVGTLPTGLSLSAGLGTITGTPSAAGTSNFTVQATGALGSQDTQALSIAITASDILPPGRPPAVGPLTQERMDFRRGTAPDCDDDPADGDTWSDTSTDPSVLKIASVTMSGTSCMSVAWAPIASSAGSLVGDGSQLTDLNASEINHGTIPADVLPSLFPAAVTFGTSVTTPLATITYADFTMQVCSELSAAGTARLCVDTLDDTPKWSINGSSYESGGASLLIGGNTPSSTMWFGTTNAIDTGWRTNGSDRLVIQSDGDTYINTSNDTNLAVWIEGASASSLFGMGFVTQPRKFSLISNLGTFRSAMQFADAGGSGDVIWGVSASVNSGSLWTPYLRVRNTGQVLVSRLQLETLAAPTCDASNRGTINYVAGGVGVKDIVQVCAKDAGGSYAYRTIY